MKFAGVPVKSSRNLGVQQESGRNRWGSVKSSKNGTMYRVFSCLTLMTWEKISWCIKNNIPCSNELVVWMWNWYISISMELSPSLVKFKGINPPVLPSLLAWSSPGGSGSAVGADKNSSGSGVVLSITSCLIAFVFCSHLAAFFPFPFLLSATTSSAVLLRDAVDGFLEMDFPSSSPSSSKSSDNYLCQCPCRGRPQAYRVLCLPSPQHNIGGLVCEDVVDFHFFSWGYRHTRPSIWHSSWELQVWSCPRKHQHICKVVTRMAYNVDDTWTEGQIKTGRTNRRDDQDSATPQLFKLCYNEFMSLVALGTINSQQFNTIKFEALVR